MLRALLGSTWLRLFGWRVEGVTEVPRKCVFIAAPHTTNWDLPFMLAIAWVMRLRVSWLGKAQLFRAPLFGGLMRALGGIPIDRSTRGDTVSRVATRLRESERMILAVPPEGTRGVSEYWKSGFYHIAVQSGLPIGLGYLDYPHKRGGVGGIVHPTGDVRADMERIREFYRDIRGKYPHNEGTPRLREEDEPAAPSS